MGILADLIGAFVSAPVAVAGVSAKGLGDAVQLGAKDTPTLGALGETISRVGELARDGAAAINDMTSLIPNVNFAALGRSISGFTSSLTPGSQELSQSLVHVHEIAPPKVALATKYDVNPADDFSHGITFNSKSGGIGGQIMA